LREGGKRKYIIDEVKLYLYDDMDNDPKTRKETKKSGKDKAGDVYSKKHVRLQEALREKREKSK
jgi:hypothetical protein